jgi:hypothetical protein
MKTAVVVIHGIGSQEPMVTTKSLVENIIDENDIAYSSPDRIAHFYETRRLNIRKKNIDFYEFYWANLVTEPNSSDLYSWLYKLVYKKKPSDRLKKLIRYVRIVLFLLVLIAIGILYGSKLFFDYLSHFRIFNTNYYLKYILSIAIPLISFFLFKYLPPRVNKKAAETVGDAVKYLTPAPQNIESRYKIREKGIQLLRKLHEDKDESGNQKYNKIIIIGHSLGSVVAYDIITYLWHEFAYKYEPKTSSIDQKALLKMKRFVVNYKKNHIPFNLQEYRQIQEELFLETKELGNPWLITDFLTLGSPLCHGDFLMSENFDAFEKKINYREFPISPPKIDLIVKTDQKTRKDEIVKNYDEPIFFNKKYTLEPNKFVDVKVLHHAAPFAVTKWTNLYFKNDFVGGDMKCFGKGIENHAITPKGNWKKRNLPATSHTDYWDKTQKKSLEIIKEIILKK